MAGLIELIVCILLFVIVAASFYASRDRLRPYCKDFRLQKAALAYSGSLEKLKQTILPVRQSVFSYSEPTIWLYQETMGAAELLLTANYKKDVRIWFQPQTVLQGVHVVLDGTKNNSLTTNLMRKRLPGKQIDLEGSFPDHFKLFCNDGQEAIALQIIAPDVMAFLLDNAMDADIEIIDDQAGIIVRNGVRSRKRLQKAIDLALRMHTLVAAATKVTSL